jgi:hypothetical protein
VGGGEGEHCLEKEVILRIRLVEFHSRGGEDLLSGRKRGCLVPRHCRFLVEGVGMHL